jgi:hypothetical protein
MNQGWFKMNQPTSLVRRWHPFFRRFPATQTLLSAVFLMFSPSDAWRQGKNALARNIPQPVA